MFIERPKSEFPPTAEQEACLASFKMNRFTTIQARAGCGKTTTLRFLAESTSERVLYLAFNKAMAEEARRKMPDNVESRTLHSICYQFMPNELRHKLTRPEGGYVNVASTGGEIAKKFKIGHLIDSRGKTLVTKSMIGLMIKQTVGSYEFSDAEHIGREHFPTQYNEELKKKNVNIPKLITDVVRYAKQLWRERIDPKELTLMTHDTYVKLYQLSGSDLGYDVIFGDEFQDVNAAFLSILKNAKSAKRIVVVGDEYQSIYQFRGSSNMMKETAKLGAECELSASFRFGQRVGNLASDILSLEQKERVKLEGKGFDTQVGSMVTDFVDTSKPHTIIFRKNLTLLTYAMDKLADGVDLNMNVDTRDFVSMVDSVNALKRGDIDKVKHESILPYASWDEFVEDAESNPDAKRLLGIIVSGKAGQIAHTLRTYKPVKNAKITLTTAHKAKGLEYDNVIIANDFPSNYDKEGNWVGLNESERNLLYVAHTRAIKSLQWNTTAQEMLDVAQEFATDKAAQKLEIGNIKTQMLYADGTKESVQSIVKDEQGSQDYLLALLDRKIEQSQMFDQDEDI